MLSITGAVVKIRLRGAFNRRFDSATLSAQPNLLLSLSCRLRGVALSLTATSYVSATCIAYRIRVLYTNERGYYRLPHPSLRTLLEHHEKERDKRDITMHGEEKNIYDVKHV